MFLYRRNSHFQKDLILLVSFTCDSGFNWIYLDFLCFFIGEFAFPEDSILRFLHQTVDLIGFIWIFYVSLSGKALVSNGRV